MKNIPKMIFILLVAVACGTVTIILLYCIPVDKAFTHAKESANIFADDIINNWGGGYITATLDNPTDSLMVDIAIYRPYETVIENAMHNPHIKFPDPPKVQYLNKYLNGEKGGKTYNYDRYWHGYLLYLIPLLQVFNVGEIKIIMMHLQFLLIVVLLYLIGKKDRLLMMLFSLVLLFINLITTSINFQNADIFILTLIYSIIVFEGNAWLIVDERLTFLFLVNGITVAFFDFLTCPIVAYGIPLIMAFYLNCFEIADGIEKFVKCSAAWGSGYLGMWSGKWLISSLLTKENAFADALDRVLYRMHGDIMREGIEGTSFGGAIKSVIWGFKSPVTVFWMLLVIGVMSFYIIKGYRLQISKQWCMEVVPVMLVGLAPIVWYMIAENHAISHPYLEYRNLAVTIWAGFVCIDKAMKMKRKEL